MKALRFDAEGRAHDVIVDMDTMAPTLRVSPRDLRALDRRYARSRVPAVVGRGRAIVLNLQHFRMLIWHDGALLFDPQHSSNQMLSEQLQVRLRARRGADGDGGGSLGGSIGGPVGAALSMVDGGPQPFEFAVLEQVLGVLCHNLDRNLQNMVTSVGGALERYREDMNERSLMRLLPLKTSLTTQVQQVDEVVSAIRALLQNDEDMAQLYLTDNAQTGSPRAKEHHQEAEVLLEEHVLQLDEIRNEYVHLQRNIDLTETSVATELSNTRNRIMKVDLFMTIFTCSAAVTSLGAAIFGMNLQSSWESDPKAFFTAAYTFLGAGSATFGGLYAFCRARGLL